jgi:cytochrome c-type biogenesis protein CcmH
MSPIPAPLQGLDGAMVLWIGFAVLAAAVVWAVTRPLLAARPGPATPDTELAVYRDQLSEIESERAQGLIGVPEAEAARVEVARRLIRRAEENERPASVADTSASRVRNGVLYAAAALPVAAIAIYLAVGSPSLPGRPYAARLNVPLERASASDLVAKVEAHLRQHPDDGRGWDVLAPVYLRMGDFREAADAFERATRLLGESPQRLAGYARATIMADNGVVGEPARRAYEKLRTENPKAIEPQVWLAIAKEQDGDLAAAAADYRALIAANPQEPWKSLLNQQLMSVTAKLDGPAAGATQAEDAGRAPALGDVAMPPNVQAMTPEERQAFVEKMVDGLAAKLKTNGKDLEGWMRLMRAYSVLGKRREATNALADARSNFAGDEKSLAQLQALAQSLGLGS